MLYNCFSLFVCMLFNLLTFVQKKLLKENLTVQFINYNAQTFVNLKCLVNNFNLTKVKIFH